MSDEIDKLPDAFRSMFKRIVVVAEAKGAKEERARIVAWLYRGKRRSNETFLTYEEQVAWEEAAQRIGRGEHEEKGT